MIRQLHSDDRSQIVELVKVTGNFSDSEVEIAKELIDVCIENPGQSDYFTFVYEDAETKRIAGFLIMGPTPATAGTYDMYWIASHPDFYGRGIAQSLDAKAMEFVRERNGYLIIAETSSQKSYERTRGFYQKQGYAKVSQITDYYKPGDDLIVFGKRVDGLKA